MILLIDNYDSFTFNLAQYLGELGAPPLVRRNDEITSTRSTRSQPTHIVISPGPGRPEDAGISVEAIRRFGARTPVLGVCLGHQGIGIAFGGDVVRAPQLMHGKTSSVQHDGRGVFRGVSQPFVAGRYHSLVVGEPLPAELEVAARHGRRHDHGRAAPDFPIHGVQFHPESVLTGEGRQLLRNFLEWDDRCSPTLLEKLHAPRGPDDRGSGGGDGRDHGRAARSRAQIAGLLIGLAMKGERPAEIVGFARTMRAQRDAAVARLRAGVRHVRHRRRSRRTPSTSRPSPRWCSRRAASASPSTATDRCRASAAAPISSRRSA